MQHEEVVRREFSRQADTFDDASLFADDRLAAWISLNLEPMASQATVLEVACGASHLGEKLAERSQHVIGIDLTPAMLEHGKRRLDGHGVRNIVLQRGSVYDLPFLDESFDLVVCRFAVHHFDRPVDAINEMVRVCRRGGRIAIIDLVADAARNDAFNEMERRRDPSHTRALSVEELDGGMTSAGTTFTRRTDRDVELDVERWLAQAKTPPDVADAIRRDLRADLDGGPTTGMRVVERDGALAFVHHWHIAVARRD